jgi:hypothetical protein
MRPLPWSVPLVSPNPGMWRMRTADWLAQGLPDKASPTARHRCSCASWMHRVTWYLCLAPQRPATGEMSARQTADCLYQAPPPLHNASHLSQQAGCEKRWRSASTRSAPRVPRVGGRVGGIGATARDEGYGKGTAGRLGRFLNRRYALSARASTFCRACYASTSCATSVAGWPRAAQGPTPHAHRERTARPRSPPVSQLRATPACRARVLLR